MMMMMMMMIRKREKIKEVERKEEFGRIGRTIVRMTRSNPKDNIYRKNTQSSSFTLGIPEVRIAKQSEVKEFDV